MVTVKRSPAAALGLPAPQKSKIKDAGLLRLYERFIDQLKFVADGRVILSDPYIFSVDTERIMESVRKWYESLGDEERNKLLLLSLVSRPLGALSCKNWAAKVSFGMVTRQAR